MTTIYREGIERFNTQCLVHSGMYFPPSMRSDKCSGDLLRLPNFWMHHKSGDLNAYICQRHADYFRALDVKKSYLTQRLEADSSNVES